jgi:hypothetical protein
MSSILKGLQLNELSNKKLGDYKKAAGADATAADKAGDYKRGDKRMSGIIKATKKEFANDEKKKDVAEAGMPFRGVGGAFNRGDDERHDLDPTEWYVVKDGKMYKTSVYPNQVQLAIAQGYSRSREEAKAKADRQGVAEGSDNQEIGQQMANDGVTYSPAKENEIINLMAQYMQKAGMSSKQIRYLLSYDEDYVGDQLSFLPRQEVTEDQLDELSCWSGYHRVAGTKAGFPGSCAKNKTNEEGVAEEQHSCPHCGGEMVSEELMNEKKDACYYKVKSRYKVWPSAYASGALVKCRKSGADSWGDGGKKNESSILEGIEQVDENLNKWFKEKWVRFGPDGKIRGDCARGDDSEGKPKCLPQSKAHSLGKKGRASAASRKRREDPNPERSGKAINVNTKKQSNENIDEDWKKKLGAAALAGSMALGAAGASARVTPDGQGGFTGGLKPTATVVAPDNTPSATPPTSDPFKGLVRADSADRQAKTITVGGKEYGLVEISPTDIRPRSGQQIVVPQAVLGERGIGTYMGILTGNTVFVISKK